MSKDKADMKRTSALFDKVEIILTLGMSSKNELADYLDKPWPRIHEWVTRRAFMPSGEIALAIAEWVKAIEEKMRRKKDLWQQYLEAVAKREKIAARQ